MRNAFFPLTVLAAVSIAIPAFADQSAPASAAGSQDSAAQLVELTQSGVLVAAATVALPLRLTAAAYGAAFKQVGEGSEAGSRTDPFERRPLKVTDEVVVRAQPAPRVPAATPADAR